MPKEKILHVIGALVAGGAEKFVVDLLIEMKKQGCDVSLFVLSNRTDAAGKIFSEKLSNANIKYYLGPTKKVGVKSLISMAKNLNVIKPDYIHLHTPNTELAYYLVGRFYLRVHKLFRTIHSTSVKYGALTKRAFSKNDVVKTIACGDATYQAFKESILTKFETIQNGVAFDWLIKSKDLTRTTKNELGLDLGKKHYLCVGSMSGTSLLECPKAQDLLIKSWKKVSMGDKGAVLHLLGTGNLIDDLKDLAGKDESIIFHGVSGDVKNWLLACDYFVMPSRYEGLPIAGIEAIASGIYCILSKIKPLQELEPPYALWIEMDSQQSLSEVLESSFNENNEIVSGMIETFRKKYSIEQAAMHYIKLYS